MEQLIKAGDSFHSLWNDDRLKVVELNDRQLVVEFRHLASRPGINQPHFHHLFQQEFKILTGTATCMIDGETFTASEGDTVQIAVGQLHHDPRPNEEKLIYRSTYHFTENGLENGTRLMMWYATIYGLSYEEGIGANGLPKNPFQLVASLNESINHMQYDGPNIPAGAKTFLAIGARIVRVLGYHPWYERHLPRPITPRSTATTVTV